MPTTSVEKLDATRVKLTVRVTPEEMKPAIAHAYEHIAEQVNIPGFRKGKVPAPIIDQRVGRGAVIEHAINEGLNDWYRAALTETGLTPLTQPEADFTKVPDEKDFSGDLEVVIEVDVRPEVKLPKYEGVALTVDTVEVKSEDVDAELDAMRARFGTLSTVDRAAGNGDFVSLDLVATVAGAKVDEANGVSYEVGSGELLEGLDEAVLTLTAGEETTFESELLGGDHAGQKAEVKVVVTAVKERELPKADDEFAQMASEFDTLKELKESLKETVAKRSVGRQGSQARDLLIDALIGQVEIPVVQSLIDDEVHRHLEGEGRLEDAEHRAEVIESSTRTYKMQILFDEIADDMNIDLSQDEISNYLFLNAQQYGMSPNDFIQALSESGQLTNMIGELRRNKTLAKVLRAAKVKDAAGKAVDLTEFTRTADDDVEAGEKKPAAKSAEKPAAKKAPSKPAAEKKTAETKPAAKKPAAK